ncbi:RNA-guided endonuclease InsQ/TnpB family protein [Crenobacter caeni]|uniref:RNA-guided endonuclease InsQ/TnpB family protein n=1 Tax=Crenobacter caeni TaxID=2705474 RepID=UPI00193F43D3|nr:RNA-guided endonuclease TnpB family protein [Crenobacter caeni]
MRRLPASRYCGHCIVGIGLEIARFATLSNGGFIAPANSFKRHQAMRRKAQQALSRKTKFSNNWKKAKARVQLHHAHIGNVRKDFLLQATTTINQNRVIVCIKDLKLWAMSKSVAGDAEQLGRHERAKSGLNKVILDQGWFEFRRQLDYKLAWRGGHLITVPPHHISQTCPACGHVSKLNRQMQARFCCVECSFEENADLVGAMNVLHHGEAVLEQGQDIAS